MTTDLEPVVAVEPEAVIQEQTHSAPEGVPCRTRAPDLSKLSQKEVNAMRAYLRSAAKEARKKSVAAIYKDPVLSKVYSLALGRPGSKEDLELVELLPKNAEAFCQDWVANTLMELDAACVREISDRFVAGTKAKKP